MAGDFKLAAVTHSRTLFTLSSTEFDEDEKPKAGGLWWENCEGKEYGLIL